jgi:hypothetical protein
MNQLDVDDLSGISIRPVKAETASKSSLPPSPSSTPPTTPLANTPKQEETSIEITVRRIRHECLQSINPDAVQKDSSFNGIQPACEKNFKWMLAVTGISLFRHTKWYIKFTFPILFSLWIAFACFCPLWYPTYYINQAEVWTIDMIIIFCVYNTMLYLQTMWSSINLFEHIGISSFSNRISLFFYILFQIYWLYFAIIQFSLHSTPTFIIQLGNVVMSTAWYFFFTTSGALYYFVCTKLLQRAQSIKLWLSTLNQNSISIDEFYIQYNKQCKSAINLSKNWNFIIFLGFLLLTIHVPIDLISIIVDGNMKDIPGAIIKGLALGWYLYCICNLNDYDGRVVSHLYKQRMFALEDMQMIEQYTARRKLGLDFYGIQINTSFIMKVLLLLLNVIVPAVYSLVKKFIMKSSDS